MKTPEQLADRFAEQFRFDLTPEGEPIYAEVRKEMIAAIEADRAQRDAEPRLSTDEVGALRRVALRWQRRAYLEGVAEAADGEDRRVEKAQRLVQETKRTFYELVDRIAAPRNP